MYLNLMSTTTARRTQPERSAAMRLVLLEATVACLEERGYQGTTTAAVAQRAGVSRGAQVHHFGSQHGLLAAAVQHLAQQRLLAAEQAASQLVEDASRPRRALDLLAGALSGPLYAATLELWVAARTDADLRTVLLPVEKKVTSELRRLCRAFVTDDPVLAQLTLDLLLGRGVGGLLLPFRPGRQREALDRWARMLQAERQ
jgi:AcrR family transcriptional regulator